MDAAVGHPRIEGREVTGAAEAGVSFSREFRPGTRTIEKCLELSLETGAVFVNGEERWAWTEACGAVGVAVPLTPRLRSVRSRGWYAPRFGSVKSSRKKKGVAMWLKST